MPAQPDYPCEDPPGPGTAREVAPGVRWLRMPLPFALDHINLWLLQDDDGWTAVDTGIAHDAVKACWQRLLPSYPLRRQIVTHWHPDHLGLAGWLEQQTGAPLWITQSEYDTSQNVSQQQDGYNNASMVALFRRHGLDDEHAQALASLGNSYQRNLSPLPARYRRLVDAERVDIGGRAWCVMVGHGHSPEHAALHCAELNLLISGDMLLPRITTNVSAMAAHPDANPLQQFLDSIDRFRQLPEDTLVLPSHGQPFRGLHARIAALGAHHRERFAALLAAMERPATAAELMPVLFTRSLADPFQIMFAMGETIAHVYYLEHAQQIARTDTDGIIRFVKLH